MKLDFIAKQDDELSLRKGEKVEVLCKEQEHWWKGSINGKVGLFPANHVSGILMPWCHHFLAVIPTRD